MSSSEYTSSHPEEKRRAPYLIPLSLKVSILVISFTSLAFLVSTAFFLKRQEEILASQAVKTGEIILSVLVNSAKVPLLADDTLSLNTLVKDMDSTESLLYVGIVDQDGIITAHTESTKVGTVYTSEAISEEDNSLHRTSTLADGSHVLHVSSPVIIRGKPLATVHLGLSLDRMKSQVQESGGTMLGKLLPLGCILVFIALGVSVILSRRFVRCISQLITATREIRNGNYEYEIQRIQKNELGNLAVAFNEMAHLLQQGPRGQRRFTQQVDPEDSAEDRVHNPPGIQAAKITRSQITVLFVGIKGFKAYAETRDPEEVLRSLNEYLGVAVDTILAHGGWIDKFIGDAVIGVFESSPLQASHSERAVRSAVAMQEALRSRNDYNNQLLNRVGIGVSSGVVLAATIDADTRREQALIGESFKVAYSLHVMARPNEVVMSKDVYQLIEHLVSVEPLPPREIIDTSKPWENFRLQGILDKTNGV